MMLDVLFKIKDDQDHSLAFRRSCRYAISHLSSRGISVIGFQYSFEIDIILSQQCDQFLF